MFQNYEEIVKNDDIFYAYAVVFFLMRFNA